MKLKSPSTTKKLGEITNSKEGKEIEENLKNVPAFIPKKVINKYLKELRKEVNKGDVLKDRKVVDFDDV